MIRPTATYRLQLRDGMTFAKAAALAPYLARLGVSHLYVSPIFAAAAGSTHGYDAVDLGRLEPALGGDAGFRHLVSELKRHDLGLIVDFVPNHMGASTFNAWWRDVLEWGTASTYAEHFDIDWSAPKLIVPVLATGYADALAGGAFGLSFDAGDGGICFTYGTLWLPLTPPSYAQVLSRLELEGFAALARRFVVARPDEAEALKGELAAAAADAGVRSEIEKAMADLSRDRDAVHALHEAQMWRLTHWRAARETLTYRRFFEIPDLVGLKVERGRVFDDVHARLLEIVRDGSIAGIRLDHIDGLADPKGYLERLQAAIGGDGPFYLLVEKILGPDEELRHDWPVSGTTGYEFIRALGNLLVDPAAESPVSDAYHGFIGSAVDYPAFVLETKRRILTRNLAGELEVLKGMARALAERDYATRDLGADSLRRAILEVAVALPVYRTYVNVSGATEADRDVITVAVAAAKAAREVEDEEAIHFLSRTLLLDFSSPEDQAAALEFATRFQQTTGPVMAKALEDTVFYRYNRLIGLNEVGGEPDRFGDSPTAFHREMQRRLVRQPLGLSATATHDTKRGEDARARLYALSEMPGAWAAAVDRWSKMNAGLRSDLPGQRIPDVETEWMFYQALAGAWPPEIDAARWKGLAPFADRMAQFMLKAVREAKAHTTWTAPDRLYEDAIERFTRRALDPGESQATLLDFLATCEPIFVAGALNGLAQTVIKLAAPGVPDIYQGSELLDFSLVDPDNRRPVDFDNRSRVLDGLSQRPPEALVEDWRSGALKMRVVARGLGLRARRPELFEKGDYLALPVEGAMARHVVAFARRLGEEAVIALVPRLATGLLAHGGPPHVPAARWQDTHVALPPELSGRDWQHVLTDERVQLNGVLPVASGLERFPVAMLASPVL